MGPKPKYQEGEKVLCYHGPLMYEAKCMGHEVKDGKVSYHIHYNGWNKNWDETVQETRVVKFTEAGIQKQKELLKSHSAQTKKNKTAKKLEKELLKQGKKNEKQAAKEKTPKGGKKGGKQSTAASTDSSSKDNKERPSTPQPATPSVGDKRKAADKDKGDKQGVGGGNSSVTTTPSTGTISTTSTAKDGKDSSKKDNANNNKDRDEKSTPVSQASTPISQELSTPSSQSQAQASAEPKRKRPRLDETIETEEAYLSKLEVKVKIPDDLKPVLVDDWDLITRQKMLLTVPCKQTVDDIIDDYIKSKTSKNTNTNKDAMLETMLGCKDYFNVMLGSQLLYKFERPQYSEVMSEHPDKPMSSLYGATHLLRLFVRLGSILAYTTLDEKTVHILLTHVHDFLKYMSKNGSSLFKTSNYEIASPDYHRKAI